MDHGGEAPVVFFLGRDHVEIGGAQSLSVPDEVLSDVDLWI